MTTRRIRTWAARTNLSADALKRLAVEAATRYDNGCGDLSSGWEVGHEYAGHLIVAPTTDGGERHWGDFLIDYGCALGTRS
jgi:hypothetical protein